MKYQIKKTKVKDCYKIFFSKILDERGSFTKIFCKKKFNFLKKNIVQINESFNLKKGTLRGLHYQLPPYEEDKLIYCLTGEIYDVCLDLRKNSPTFGNWDFFKLNQHSSNMFLIPRGCAHGFYTLKSNTKIIYFTTNYYNLKKESGVKYNDLNFKIRWPGIIKVISKKDLSWNYRGN